MSPFERKEETPASSDFEVIQKHGDRLLQRMAEGLSEQEFRRLLTDSLVLLNKMSSLSSVRSMLIPENILPSSGMLSKEQVRNLFKHLSSLSKSLGSAANQPSQNQTTDMYGETVSIPMHKSDGKTAEHFFEQATFEYEMKNLWRTKELVEEAIARNSRVGKYYLLHGLCCARYPSLHKQAEYSLRTAVEIEPSEPEYRIALAKFYQNIGMPHRAMRECQNAAQIAPGNTRVQALLHELKSKS